MAPAPPTPLIRDFEVTNDKEPDQRYLTRQYTEEAIRFMKQSAGKQPFFLYLAHTMPHAPLYASEAFDGTTERGLYGDVISEIDWSVGLIIETLRDLDLDQNTFVESFDLHGDFFRLDLGKDVATCDGVADLFDPVDDCSGFYVMAQVGHFDCYARHANTSLTA